ncbi:MAG: hypothetical protein ACLPKE_04715 [Streptosporangiaceae bacterium]
MADATAGGNRAGGVAAGTASEDSAPEVAVDPAGAQQETAQHDTAPQDMAQHHTAQQDTAQQDTAQHHTPPQETAEGKTGRAGGEGDAGGGAGRPAAAEALPRRALTGAERRLAAHWQFSVVLAVAVALRCVVMVGYRPILWYSDSYNYIADAVDHVPDVVRSSGYPLFLLALLPLHSLTLLAALQALMGVLMGLAIYVVLRRRGLPWWGATLPALPVLFDVFELQLEHMVMSDVLFIFLITVAVAGLCWFDQPPVTVSVIAGLMIGYAAIVRAVGEPLLAVVVVALLLRRVNWKRVGLLLVAGLLPIVGYLAWYHSFYGQYALDGASGTFLYSRVSSFSECSKMPNLAQDLKVLCDPRPPSQRPNSQQYLWSGTAPLVKITGDNQFSKHADSIAGQFARAAIEAQPVAYAKAVLSDLGHTFSWNRTQTDVTGSGPSFRFEPHVTPVTKNATLWWVLYYPQDKDGLEQYAGPSLGQPTVEQPYSSFMIAYQKVFYLRGTLLGVILLIGAAGIIARWRRWGGLALLPWAVAAALVVLPPMTAGFSYRYVLAAVPLACLAAGLASSRETRSSRKAAAAAVRARARADETASVPAQ